MMRMTSILLTHVELSDEAGYVAMFEVKGQDFLGKVTLVIDMETLSRLKNKDVPKSVVSNEKYRRALWGILHTQLLHSVNAEINDERCKMMSSWLADWMDG